MKQWQTKQSCMLLVLGVLWKTSLGFVGNSHGASVSRRATASRISRITSPSISSLNLGVGGKPSIKRRSDNQRSALSHPRPSTIWDSILIPAHQPNDQHDHVTALDKTFIVAFFGFATAILAKFVVSSSPGSWRYFLAGGLCAASSHAIPTPVDVIKVIYCDYCCFVLFVFVSKLLIFR
jgi:hypothetical protein